MREWRKFTYFQPPEPEHHFLITSLAGTSHTAPPRCQEGWDLSSLSGQLHPTPDPCHARETQVSSGQLAKSASDCFSVEVCAL